jgi:RNA polymerase sigma factor (sigma-70 family)
MNRTGTVERPDFEEIVEWHYPALYRFALGLVSSETGACELVQYTFRRWASAESLLHGKAEIKAWLSAALYRQYISDQGGNSLRPDQGQSEQEIEPQVPTAEAAEGLEPLRVMECLQSIDETFRVPLLLFFVQDHSCREIAEILSIPVGTAFSRLSWGKRMLWNAILELPPRPAHNGSKYLIVAERTECAGISPPSSSKQSIG